MLAVALALALVVLLAGIMLLIRQTALKRRYQTLALRDELTAAFSEREVVIVVTTSAQVNFWARTIAGLGIPAAGFCQLPSAGEHRRTPPVSDHD